MGAEIRNPVLIAEVYLSNFASPESRLVFSSVAGVVGLTSIWCIYHLRNHLLEVCVENC